MFVWYGVLVLLCYPWKLKIWSRTNSVYVEQLWSPSSSYFTTECCRYGVASRTLDPGEEVLSEFPVVMGPKPESYVMCLGCYAPVDGSTTCSKCGWPVCGPECEKLPCHASAECQVFSSAGAKFQPVENCMDSCPQLNCIAPLRLLLSKDSNPERWETEVKFMEAHNEERKNIYVWENNQINVVDYLRNACKLADR